MKPTNSQLHDLQKRIAQAQAQPRRRYGSELKREIVTYAAARHSQKVSIRKIATELGLSGPVLTAWMRHARLRQEAGKIPFERRRRNAAPVQRTASTAEAAPAEDDDPSSNSES